MDKIYTDTSFQPDCYDGILVVKDKKKNSQSFRIKILSTNQPEAFHDTDTCVARGLLASC